MRLTILALLLIPTTATAQEIASVSTRDVFVSDTPIMVEQFGNQTLIQENLDITGIPGKIVIVSIPTGTGYEVKFEDDDDDRTELDVESRLAADQPEGFLVNEYLVTNPGRTWYYINMIVMIDGVPTPRAKKDFVEIGELVPVDPPVDPPTNTLSDISRRGAVAAEDPVTAKLMVTKIEESLQTTSRTNDPSIVYDGCKLAAANGQRRLGRPVASDWTQWNKTVGANDMSPLMADEMRKAWRDVVQGLKDSTAVVTVTFEVVK